MGLATPEILERIPHRRPFLFVDKILDHEEGKILTSYQVTGEEDFFKGHFPGNPIMPGVILMEAVFQSGALSMSFRKEAQSQSPIVGRASDIKFKNFVRPNDLLKINVSLKHQLRQVYYMAGEVRVAERLVLSLNFTGMHIDFQEKEK